MHTNLINKIKNKFVFSFKIVPFKSANITVTGKNIRKISSNKKN